MFFPVYFLITSCYFFFLGEFPISSLGGELFGLFLTLSLPVTVLGILDYHCHFKGLPVFRAVLVYQPVMRGSAQMLLAVLLQERFVVAFMFAVADTGNLFPQL